MVFGFRDMKPSSSSRTSGGEVVFNPGNSLFLSTPYTLQQTSKFKNDGAFGKSYHFFVACSSWMVFGNSLFSLVVVVILCNEGFGDIVCCLVHERTFFR